MADDSLKRHGEQDGSPESNLNNAAEGEGMGQATSAGTQALDDPSEHHAEPSAFGLTATAWVSVAMLVVIAILIWKKVPALIGRALDRKIEGIRTQLDEAARLRSDAEALKAEYEARTSAAGGEVQAMLDRARGEADGIVAQARLDADALVARRTAMAEAKIAAAERAAVADVRARVADAATAAAAHMIAERHGVAEDRALVNRTISDLGRLN